MANVNTNTRIQASNRRTIQYLVIDSDGTEETDLVVYDSSAVTTVLKIADPLDSTIVKLRGVVDAAVGTAKVELQWDATTDVLAFALPINHPFTFDFHDIGGLTNPAGTGITGDITLTTVGLAAGDNITLILEVRPN